MNGNFEHDRGSYPYGTIRLGDNHFIGRVSAGEKLYEKALPAPVVAAVALRINSAFYSRDEVKLAEVIGNIPQVIREEVASAHATNKISGFVAQQVLSGLE